MSKHDDQRFHNFITTGAYVTDDEMIDVGLLVFVCVVVVVVYALYRIFV